MEREVIKSKTNPKIKAWKKLLNKKERTKTQSYIIEGTHLVLEALQEKAPIIQWIMTEKYYDENPSVIQLISEGAKFVFITEGVANDLSATQSPQGIFAILEMGSTEEFNWDGSRYVLIDQVQDPGNLGTIIRTADAAAVDGVIIGSGSVDVYNDKVIRSTQGSIWHLPIIEMELTDAIRSLQDNQVKVYATVLHKEAKAYTEIQSIEKMALIVGNEGQGVQEKLQSLADEFTYIPMPGKAESLNVAVATAILLFHFIRI
ncbi:TrmH family RNA methyltransferase [Aerococcaceae bacterium WGS1372]